jgi:GDPmannose 4,6-dehydratase
LSRELQAAGREVLGTGRRGLPSQTFRNVDYRDDAAIRSLLDEFRPDEIYHLACPSQLEDSESFERDVLQLSTLTTLTFLRWISDRSPGTRFFFAGSSEIFGNPALSPQNENCPPRPAHPYAVAKLAGQQLIATFRDRKNVFACTGILYNHESHLRRRDFVSRWITCGIAEIVAGRRSRLETGNLEAVRDWSHASDFARGFRLCLEASEPRDFVFGSGVKRTVREFCDVAFRAAGLDAGRYLFVDAKRFREDFPCPRVGDPSLALEHLGWRAERPFNEWVAEMVRADLGKGEP